MNKLNSFKDSSFEKNTYNEENQKDNESNRSTRKSSM